MKFFVNFSYDYTYWEDQEDGWYSIQRKGKVGSGKRIEAPSESQAKAILMKEIRRMYRREPWYKEMMKSPWKNFDVILCKEQ